MPARNHVENPTEYLMQRFSWTMADIDRAMRRPRARTGAVAVPEVRRIGMAEVGAALREGLSDLGRARSDVVFLAIVYPLAGLVLAALAFSLDLAPLVLPLVAGFALLGPVAAVGLYQVSRRLEEGRAVSWSTPFEVLRSPAMGSIAGFGAVLAVIFLTWLAVAWAIYAATLGPEPPASLGAFVREVFGTAAGWTMAITGILVGAVFAALVFCIGVVSTPLMLDRDVGLATAMRTSLKVVRANPGPMAAWGAIIAGGLVLGALPALAGLIFVMPLFGHASWRMYRKLVA